MTVYPDYSIGLEDSVWDAFQKIYEKSENKFLFVMDEWDAVFHMPFFKNRVECPKFSREELCIWYDGYHAAMGKRLYNPHSIVLALTDNQLKDHNCKVEILEKN